MLRRLRRLRRPVAVVLLISVFFSFMYPVYSHAAYKILYNVVKYGSRAGITLGRTGSFARAANEIRVPLAAFRAMSTGQKVKYLASEAVFAAEIGMAWKWIKNHPGDAADIGGTLLDLINFFRDNDMPHTADSLDKALNNRPSNSTDNLSPGDTYKDDKCGTLEVVNKETGVGLGCSTSPPQTDDSCSVRLVSVYVSGGTCGDPSASYYKGDRIYFRKIADPVPMDDKPVPDTLSPEQEKRLLDEIEKKLQQHKDDMERELDELLKKNLDDIDWPEFDNEKAQEYLRSQRTGDLQNEIDRLEEELRRIRENNNNNNNNNCQCDTCTENCQVVCCADRCNESQIQQRLDQLRDRLEQLNQQQEDEAVQEYTPPVVPEPELKKIDFQPISDLKGELMTKFPFNMLQLIPSALQVLTAEPTAPYWDANLGEMGGTHRVDFSVLNSLASFIRLVLSWLCYIGAVFCCLKIWSRF